MQNINEIFTKSLISEKKRSELVIKTPKVIVQEPTLNWQRKREVRYYYTWLGRVRAWEMTSKGKTWKHLDYAGGQTFRLGVVRYTTPELEHEIEQIDAEIKALQTKRQEVLKEKFLWLHPVPYEDIRRTQKVVAVVALVDEKLELHEETAT